MEKADFLNVLRQTLAGEVEQKIIDDNIRYYDDYIMMEVKKGRTENSVLETLGDPRLIAKTIIETKRSSIEQGTGYSGGEEDMEKAGMFTLPSWAMLILYVIAGIVLIGVIGSLVSALLPIIIPVVIIVMIISFVKRRKM